MRQENEPLVCGTIKENIGYDSGLRLAAERRIAELQSEIRGIEGEINAVERDIHDLSSVQPQMPNTLMPPGSPRGPKLPRRARLLSRALDIRDGFQFLSDVNQWRERERQRSVLENQISSLRERISRLQRDIAEQQDIINDRNRWLESQVAAFFENQCRGAPIDYVRM